ncbi:MAG: hypothetical protein ACREEM_46910 [Blastocatellia bacterium]
MEGERHADENNKTSQGQKDGWSADDERPEKSEISKGREVAIREAGYAN